MKCKRKERRKNLWKLKNRARWPLIGRVGLFDGDVGMANCPLLEVGEEGGLMGGKGMM